MKRTPSEPANAMRLTELFTTAGPSILAFVAKVVRGPAGKPPLFPTIFGTGFLINPDGLAVTNRHVIEVFSKIPRNPKTGNRVSLRLPSCPVQLNRIVTHGRCWSLTFASGLA